MDWVNRLISPMALYVEDLTKCPLELERRRETAQKAVRESPAPFLVGSMEAVAQKIPHLEQHLNSFCTDDLVIESPERCGTSSEVGCFTPRAQFERKNKEYDRKELQKFTQRYRLSVTKTHFSKYPKTTEIKSKPKLVELYQFPGFSDHGPMPLPHDISLTTITEKVVSAHKNTGAKICPTRELCRILGTPVAQKILLDCYWWIFLHRYKPDAECQRKLFGRVAENYIQLLTLCEGSYHGDAFLNSLHQFQSKDFIAQLCRLLWQWIGGISPISGVCNTWDYKTLEPIVDTTNGKVKQKKGEHNGCPTTSSFRPRNYSVIKPSRKNSSAANQTLLYKTEATISLSSEHLQCLPGSEAEIGKLKTGLQSSKATPAKESHTACQRPNVIHTLFNLSGHSPLIQYYLDRKRANSQTGVSVLVHRTETPYPFLKGFCPLYML